MLGQRNVNEDICLWSPKAGAHEPGSAQHQTGSVWREYCTETGVIRSLPYVREKGSPDDNCASRLLHWLL